MLLVVNLCKVYGQHLAKQNCNASHFPCLQEGCKGLLYMVLHARVVLDLCEHLEQEISFEQVEGDFDSFQGKWILEQLGSHHTLLKYNVESKTHRDTFLSEAIMEEVLKYIQSGFRHFKLYFGSPLGLFRFWM
jgi:hypothetical protein